MQKCNNLSPNILATNKIIILTIIDIFIHIFILMYRLTVDHFILKYGMVERLKKKLVQDSYQMELFKK